MPSLGNLDEIAFKKKPIDEESNSEVKPIIEKENKISVSLPCFHRSNSDSEPHAVNLITPNNVKQEDAPNKLETTEDEPIEEMSSTHSIKVKEEDDKKTEIIKDEPNSCQTPQTNAVPLVTSAAAAAAAAAAVAAVTANNQQAPNTSLFMVPSQAIKVEPGLPPLEPNEEQLMITPNLTVPTRVSPPPPPLPLSTQQSQLAQGMISSHQLGQVLCASASKESEKLEEDTKSQPLPSNAPIISVPSAQSSMMQHPPILQVLYILIY